MLRPGLTPVFSSPAESGPYPGHRDHRATAQWAIELLASRRFKRYLRITKGGQVRTDRAAIQNAAKYDGKWVIETNDDTISLEDAACDYKGLMVIERCFRSLKRTQLALLLERVAELECNLPWSRIQRELDRLQVTEFFDLKNRVLMRNEISSETANILKKLKIQTPKQILKVENPD